MSEPEGPPMRRKHTGPRRDSAEKEVTSPRAHRNQWSWTSGKGPVYRVDTRRETSGPKTGKESSLEAVGRRSDTGPSCKSPGTTTDPE